MSSSIFLHHSFGQNTPLNLQLTDWLVWLERAPGILMSLSLISTGITDVHAFAWVLGL